LALTARNRTGCWTSSNYKEGRGKPRQLFAEHHQRKKMDRRKKKKIVKGAEAQATRRKASKGGQSVSQNKTKK